MVPAVPFELYNLQWLWVVRLKVSRSCRKKRACCVLKRGLVVQDSIHWCRLVVVQGEIWKCKGKVQWLDLWEGCRRYTRYIHTSKFPLTCHNLLPLNIAYTPINLSKCFQSEDTYLIKPCHYPLSCTNSLYLSQLAKFPYETDPLDPYIMCFVVWTLCWILLAGKDGTN